MLKICCWKCENMILRNNRQTNSSLKREFAQKKLRRGLGEGRLEQKNRKNVESNRKPRELHACSDSEVQ